MRLYEVCEANLGKAKCNEVSVKFLLNAPSEARNLDERLQGANRLTVVTRPERNEVSKSAAWHERSE